MATAEADGELDILDIDDLFGGDEEMLFGDELALSPLFAGSEDQALVPVPPVPPLPDPQPPAPVQAAASAPASTSTSSGGRRRKSSGTRKSKSKSKAEASPNENVGRSTSSKTSSSNKSTADDRNAISSDPNSASTTTANNSKSAGGKRGSEKKSEAKPTNAYKPLPKNEDLNLTLEQMKMFFPFIPLPQEHGSRKFVKHFPKLESVHTGSKPLTKPFSRELIAELHQLVGVMADQHLYLSTHNARMDAWLQEFAPTLFFPKTNETVPATNSSAPIVNSGSNVADHATSALPDKSKGEYMVKLKLRGVQLPQSLTAIKKGFVQPPAPKIVSAPAATVPQRQKRERAVPKPAFPTIRHIKSRICTPPKVEKPPPKLVDLDEITLWQHVSSLESNINLKNVPKFLTETSTRRAHNFGLFRNKRRKLDKKVEKSFNCNKFGLFDKLTSLLVPEEGDDDDDPKAKRGRFAMKDELDVSSLSVDERTFVHLRAAKLLPDIVHLGHSELDDIIDEKIADLNEEVVSANDSLGRIRDDVIDFVSHEEMCKKKAKTNRAHILKYQQLLLKKHPNCKKSQKDAWLAW
uniref:Uncharacterized protein n=1 Tax=Leptocylindrus danicus TaxID=163516 RepID=A0A7S2KFI8_9STRA|mmetsp:Transcript_21774/g.32544  ORF Transcript_21774/g.32544 Transcript_21774/m.32544 type:complete len:578 (+) Transcript_21774:69-1802(+)